MQQKPIINLRSPTRLEVDKENLCVNETQPIDKNKSIKNAPQKVKHQFNTHFPKLKEHKQLFSEHPENQSLTYKVKERKSLSVGSVPMKQLVEDVRRRLSTDDSQRNQELMKRRKSQIGNIAYIPITFGELRQTIKKRNSRDLIINL